jgi:predicted PurR-regulated permease PerM
MNSFPSPTPGQARLLWLAMTGLAVAVLLGLVVGFAWGLGQILQVLSPVLWPIAVASVLAYLLDPVVDFIEARGASRTRAVVYVFCIALVLLAGFFSSIVPQAVRQGRELAARLPTYTSSVEVKMENWINNPPPLLRNILRRLVPRMHPEAPVETPGTATPDTLSETNVVPAPPNASPGTTNAAPAANPSLNSEGLQTATGLAAKFLPGFGSWLFGQVGRVASWFGVLAGLALIPVYTFYFLLEKRAISEQWTKYLPVRDSAFKAELVFVLNSINNYLIAFFRGQVLVAICDGILYGVGFLLVGLPYAIFIGVAAIVLTIIPFIGAIIVCTSALVIALVQFGDWLHPLLVLGVFAFVQLLEGLVISPRIMGGRVGLHPVTIIVAVMVGTTLLGGLLGGILAIPLTAALRVLMFRYVWRNRTAPVAADPV